MRNLYYIIPNLFRLGHLLYPSLRFRQICDEIGEVEYDGVGVSEMGCVSVLDKMDLLKRTMRKPTVEVLDVNLALEYYLTKECEIGCIFYIGVELDVNTFCTFSSLLEEHNTLYSMLHTLLDKDIMVKLDLECLTKQLTAWYRGLSDYFHVDKSMLIVNTFPLRVLKHQLYTSRVYIKFFVRLPLRVVENKLLITGKPKILCADLTEELINTLEVDMKRKLAEVNYSSVERKGGIDINTHLSYSFDSDTDFENFIDLSARLGYVYEANRSALTCSIYLLKNIKKNYL